MLVNEPVEIFVGAAPVDRVLHEGSVVGHVSGRGARGSSRER